MYSALSWNPFGKLILCLFGGLIVFELWLQSNSISLWGAFKLVGSTTGVFLVALSGLMGTSSYWSPWRILWRLIPALNKWVYPDLNGVWYGATQSNWPVIAKVRNAAEGNKKIDLSKLDKVPLLEGQIAMNIEASFFRISIRSKVQSTNGDSYSRLVRASKSSTEPKLTLSYIYQQSTPQPAGTDESSHLGAATLEIKVGEPGVIEGQYWTRRKWREGMNTAGLIRLHQVTQRHATPTDDLLSFAKSRA